MALSVVEEDGVEIVDAAEVSELRDPVRSRVRTGTVHFGRRFHEALGDTFQVFEPVVSR